jgi:cytoskeleton protein RodZ
VRKRRACGADLTIGHSTGIVGTVTEEKERLLGDWLRQRREELDISLEQVEEATRIRVRYLQALEVEDFEALPDPMVGRGFLRNYASYLELDPVEASRRYSKLVAPPQPESVPTGEEPSPSSAEPFRPVPLHEMPGFRSQRGLLVGILLVLVAALAVLAWWGYPYVRFFVAQIVPDPLKAVATSMPRTANSTVATATQKATIPPATTSAPATDTPAQTTPTLEVTMTPTFTPSPSPSPSPPIYTGIFLELVFTDTSWIQVTVDGVRQFQGELDADTYKSWYGEERVELRIGNAGAVEVTVNGQNLGHLGGVGEVVDRIFEKMGDEVAEATLTPPITGTITTTPTTAPTLRPTAPPATEPPAVEPTLTLTPAIVVSPTVISTTTP